MRTFRIVAAAGLAMSASSALAQVTMDGVKDAGYGAALWVQTNPTQFGDSVDGPPCDPFDLGGDPGAVVTGMEFAIPLASIGSPAGAFKMMAFVTDGGFTFTSNQFLPGLPADNSGLGDSLDVDLNNVAGTQFVQFTPAVVGTAPTMDGTLDAMYGSALALQTARTGFGDNADSTPDSASGSELDGLYAVQSGGTLFVFITGTLESNFNKLQMMFDTETGGQNTMSGSNPDVDFNNLNNLAGFTHDAGFEADYWVGFTNGGTPNTGYVNYARLNFGADLGGPSGYQGSTNAQTLGALNGTNAAGLAMTYDWSDTAGVVGTCPPSGEDYGSGSELDQFFAFIDGDRLNMLFAGNLETGAGAVSSNAGNKLMIFVDAVPGAGQPTLVDNNLGISFGTLRNMGKTGPLSSDGLTFDSGFAPDYWIQAKITGSPVGHAIDTHVLRTNGPLVTLSGDLNDYAAFDRNFKFERLPVPYDGPRVDAIPSTGGGDPLTNYGPRTTQQNPGSPVAGLVLGYVNNANRGGVDGSSAAGASSVTTGVEISIDLDELGWDGVTPPKVAAFITNEDATFASNQVLGGLPPEYDTKNLGADFLGTRDINFQNIAGDQWVEVPLPAGCPADLTGEGDVNTNDFFLFLAFYQAQDPRADFSPGGGINTNDFFAFLAAYQQGLIDC